MGIRAERREKRGSKAPSQRCETPRSHKRLNPGKGRDERPRNGALKK